MTFQLPSQKVARAPRLCIESAARGRRKPGSRLLSQLQAEGYSFRHNTRQLPRRAGEAALHRSRPLVQKLIDASERNVEHAIRMNVQSNILAGLHIQLI